MTLFKQCSLKQQQTGLTELYLVQMRPSQSSARAAWIWPRSLVVHVIASCLLFIDCIILFNCVRSTTFCSKDQLIPRLQFCYDALGHATTSLKIPQITCWKGWVQWEIHHLYYDLQKKNFSFSIDTNLRLCFLRGVECSNAGSLVCIYLSDIFWL